MWISTGYPHNSNRVVHNIKYNYLNNCTICCAFFQNLRIFYLTTGKKCAIFFLPVGNCAERRGTENNNPSILAKMLSGNMLRRITRCGARYIVR